MRNKTQKDPRPVFSSAYVSMTLKKRQAAVSGFWNTIFCSMFFGIVETSHSQTFFTVSIFFLCKTSTCFLLPDESFLLKRKTPYLNLLNFHSSLTGLVRKNHFSFSFLDCRSGKVKKKCALLDGSRDGRNHFSLFYCRLSINFVFASQLFDCYCSIIAVAFGSNQCQPHTQGHPRRTWDEQPCCLKRKHSHAKCHPSFITLLLLQKPAVFKGLGRSSWKHKCQQSK